MCVCVCVYVHVVRVCGDQIRGVNDQRVVQRSTSTDRAKLQERMMDLYAHQHQLVQAQLNMFKLSRTNVLTRLASGRHDGLCFSFYV